MSQFIAVISRTWLCVQLYGWRFAPNIDSFAEPYMYVKAMLYTAGASQLAHSERAYIEGLVEVLLTHEDAHELVGFVAHYRVDDEEVGSTAVSKFLKTKVSLGSLDVARVLLYDAVAAAHGDNEYDTKERLHVQQVAKQLGLPTERVRAIENLVQKEVQLRERKARLFATLKKD